MPTTVEQPDIFAEIESLPLGFLQVDSTGRVLAANRYGQALLGWPDETIGTLPNALLEFIDHLNRHRPPLEWHIGVSFSLNHDCWREAWVCSDTANPAGGTHYRIFLRAVDQQRRQYFESYARLRQLMLIGEITAALNSTLGLEETFNVILVGVTAGEGLGFNRAFLFLAEDDKDEWLIGRTAIGPAGPAQAGKIWDALSEPGTGGLLDAVCTYRMALDGDDAEVNRRVRMAQIPRGGPDNPFAEVIQGARARVIRLGDKTHADVQAVFTSLDAHELACAPLRSRDRVVGLLLADHRITGEPITPDSLRGLGLLAAQAGFAVERAALADKLEQQMVEVRQAHKKIAGIQEIVARMERFSVVGEITAEVTHQIRNPLTIIGGFARNLLSSKKPEDQEYRGLSVICKQADRVCEVLERVISIDGWEGRPHQTFELEPVLWQTLAVMEIRFASRQVSWSFHPELADFTLTGRPDALRFALFEVFSGMLEHLKSGTKVIVRASNADGGARVVICPRAADKDSVDFRQTVAGIFQGRWGTGPTQRNLALEYLSEHQAALGMEKVDGRPSLVIDFEVVEEEIE